MSYFSQLDLALKDHPDEITFDIKIGNQATISVQALAASLDANSFITKNGDIIFQHNEIRSARLIFDRRAPQGFWVRDHYADSKASRRELYAYVCQRVSLHKNERLTVLNDHALQWLKAKNEAVRRENAEAKWNAALPISGTIVETYLQSRGLTTPNTQELRFLSAVDHPDENMVSPAMIARVSDPLTCSFKGIHVTALKADGTGKAQVTTSAKWLHGPTGGGVARFGSATLERLAIAEGIETALSFGQLFDWPTWAALNAGNLAAIELPGTISEVTIAADPDPTGLRYAQSARDKFLKQGRRVQIVFPKSQDDDWNDILRKRNRG